MGDPVNLVDIKLADVKVGQEITVWRMPDGHGGQGGRVTEVTDAGVVLSSGTAEIRNEFTVAEIHHITVEEALPAEDCLDYSDECRGPVDYHSIGSSLKGFPRCDFHLGKRLERREGSSEMYADSDVPPSWFNASWGGTNEYGEHWDDY